jgi:hypothetical protein
MRVTVLAALAGSLFLVPVIMGQAKAGVSDLKGAFGTTESDVTLVGRGGGRGGGGMGGRGGGGGHHFGGGGGRHFGGISGGGRHFSGGGRHGGQFARGGGRHYASGGWGGRHVGRVDGGRHYASRSWDGGNRHVGRVGGRKYAWHDGSRNRHGDHRDHKHRHHDRFDHRFVGAGVGLGWWPGYYSYGYGGCAWLRRQALYTGSAYWWNRYYACTGAYYD